VEQEKRLCFFGTQSILLTIVPLKHIIWPQSYKSLVYLGYIDETVRYETIPPVPFYCSRPGYVGAGTHGQS
jgi:hypothetical protein